jgi:hypothetical protein
MRGAVPGGRQKRLRECGGRFGIAISLGRTMRHCVQRSIANSVFKQIAILLAIVLAVGIGFGILLLVKSSEIKPPTSAQQSQKPPTNSEPLNDAQREAQATAPVSASAPPPRDFRGVKWGSRPALWMQKIDGPSGEDKISTWKNSKKLSPFMNVPVAEETYLFENYKLYAGEMFFDGEDNFNTLKTALINALGTPISSNDRLQTYKWQWRDPSFFLSLHYQSKFSRATVHIENETPLWRKIKPPPQPKAPSIDKSPKTQQGRPSSSKS